MLKLTSREGNEIFTFDSVAEIDAYIDPTKFKKQETKFTGEELAEWKDVERKLQEAWQKGSRQ